MLTLASFLSLTNMTKVIQRRDILGGVIGGEGVIGEDIFPQDGIGEA